MAFVGFPFLAPSPAPAAELHTTDEGPDDGAFGRGSMQALFGPQEKRNPTALQVTTIRGRLMRRNFNDRGKNLDLRQVPGVPNRKGLVL